MYIKPIVLVWIYDKLFYFLSLETRKLMMKMS